MLERFEQLSAATDLYTRTKLVATAGIALEYLSGVSSAGEIPLTLYNLLPSRFPKFDSSASGMIARRYCGLLVEKLYNDDLQSAVPSFRFITISESLIQLGSMNTIQDLSPPTPLSCPMALPDYGALAKQWRAESGNTYNAAAEAELADTSFEWQLTRSASLRAAEQDFHKVLNPWPLLTPTL